MHYFDRIKVANPFQSVRANGTRFLKLQPSNEDYNPTQAFPGFKKPPQNMGNSKVFVVSYLIEEIKTGKFEIGVGHLRNSNKELDRSLVLDSSSSTSGPVHELGFFKGGKDRKSLATTSQNGLNENNSYLLDATLALIVTGFDLNQQHTGGLIKSMIFGD